MTRVFPERFPEDITTPEEVKRIVMCRCVDRSLRLRPRLPAPAPALVRACACVQCRCAHPRPSLVRSVPAPLLTPRMLTLLSLFFFLPFSSSGKIYYELLEYRAANSIDDVAIVSIEQLLPFPFDHTASVVEEYPNAQVVWAQEEPKNMGAWTHVQERLMAGTEALLGKEIRPQYVGRKTMASPAEGYAKTHERDQARILAEAMTV